jgi:hypothetical protein
MKIGSKVFENGVWRDESFWVTIPQHRIPLMKSIGCAIDDEDEYIFTEREDYAWQSAEPSFTKRIYTEIPTKRRLRVTPGR